MSSAGEAAGTWSTGRWPFFYPTECKSLETGSQLVCVQGGRGHGRTNFLMELQHRTTGGMVGVPSQGFLNGRRLRESRSALAELVPRKGQVGTLFIDNLDALLAHGDPEVERWVQYAIDSFSDAGRRLVASIALLPDEALSRSRAWSDGIMPLQVRTELNPWAVHWAAFLPAAAAERWGGRYGAAEVRVWGRTLLLNPDLVAHWTRVVVELTGGHPTLVGPATEALRRLVETPDPAAPTGGDQPAEEIPLMDLLRRYLSGVLAAQGLPAIRQRVAALRTSRIAVEQKAYRLLLDLAEGKPVDWPEPYHLVTQVIRRDGLAYEKGGEWRIPGHLLRAELLVAAEAAPPGPAPRPRAPVEAPLRVLSSGPDNKRGTLLFGTAEGQKTVVLTGLSWEIFRRLHEAGGDPVALTTLAGQLEMKMPALRSAIRRLQEALRKAGHGELMRNTRGGYALRLPA